MLVPILILCVTSAATFVAGAVASVAARMVGNVSGILGYVLAPILLMAAACGLIGGQIGALAGLSAMAFVAGALACGLSARPVLARLRLMTPATSYSNWS